MAASTTTHQESPRARRQWALWPGTLAGRVAILLMLCLLAGAAVSFGVYIHDRAQATIRVFALSVANRIDAIVALMDATPAGERGKLLPALNSPTLWIVPSPERTATLSTRWERHDHAIELVKEFLPRLSSRITEVRVYDGWRARYRFDQSAVGLEPVPDLLPSRRKMFIAVNLKDGARLGFIVSSDTTSLRWVARMGFWLFTTAALIALFSIWAARRLTRPLRRFTAAADQLGLDVRAPPLPEQGSRELRRATAAFNRMQGRIRRLVDDRTMMLAAISHDLRTMLTRLRLRTEFIEDPEQQEKAFGDIDEMQAMLESTLSFARDDTEIEVRTDLDVAALLQGLCDDLTDAGSKADYEGPDRLTYRGGPLSLKRAFGNLVNNAIKYGGEALVTLADGDGAVEVVVSDRGPGIPGDMREKVFQPFFRLEPSRSRETGGAGLGLAVARSIIRRHGGDIVLEDRDGGGLTVRVRLPHAVEPGLGP